MHDDVETFFPKIIPDAGHETVDREITGVLVALARLEIFGRVFKFVECCIERINALELQQLAIG